ncbi:hypothetical protein A9976_27595 [Delftia sp. UME58]|nr:hypothetical protein [Delftia sp. UME58]
MIAWDLCAQISSAWRQSEQGNALATFWIINLLVRRCTVPVGKIKILGQGRPTAFKPFVVIAACQLHTWLPPASDRPQPDHRIVLAAEPSIIEGFVEHFDLWCTKFIFPGFFDPCLVQESASNRIEFMTRKNLGIGVFIVFFRPTTGSTKRKFMADRYTSGLFWLTELPAQ